MPDDDEEEGQDLFQLYPNIAPFPVQRMSAGYYRAKLSDISAYLNEWSHGQHMYADSRYVGHWLTRIGIQFDEDNLGVYDAEDYSEVYVQWTTSKLVGYIPIPYEDAY